jgi:hypothetical protein
MYGWSFTNSQRDGPQPFTGRAGVKSIRIFMIDDMDELKALIIAKLDVIDLLDLLGMGIEDLVDLLEDELEENSVKLHKACR